MKVKVERPDLPLHWRVLSQFVEACPRLAAEVTLVVMEDGVSFLDPQGHAIGIELARDSICDRELANPRRTTEFTLWLLDRFPAVPNG
jgi:hypothetical protein